MGYRQDYEEYYGIKVDKSWHIHHIDYNHNNNDINNLVALPDYIHIELHRAHDEWELCKQNFSFSDIQLYTGKCCGHSRFMETLTDYVNAVSKCTPYMNTREFYRMRKEGNNE